jgi:cephalosporin-C deacetylase-like acetyl esterase
MRVKFAVLIFFFYSCTAIAAEFEYQIKAVKYKNLAAKLYLPKSDQKVPVVIAFGGSEGGFSFGDANGEMIAPHGIAVLAVAYFRSEGLPQTLDHIPLEYFVSAIDFLETSDLIDGNRIGVISGSRGSEPAFLVAALDSRIKSVAVAVPSEVAWYGSTTSSSAWTLDGKDIPALSLELEDSAPQVSRFEAALKNTANVRKAMFAFEKINGPILMVSAINDQVWPSYQMGNDIEKYLKEHQFRFPVIHKSYSTGHGFSKDTAPEIKQMFIQHFLHTL